ncbi:MurR/RpiR family transcriptional regulator, partial [Aggregatibacter actinomycetemcomitans]
MKEKSQLTNLQTEIQTRYDSLSKRLKQVAQYILDNSDSIVFDTVATIAEKADVPPSTLIRFAAEFGFSGFNEMKQIFRENLMEKTTNYTERLQLSHKIAQSEGEESPEDILTIFS